MLTITPEVATSGVIAIALIGGQVKIEEGVAVPEVAASQSVPLVLPNLAGRGEQAHVAHDEEVVFEIGLEKFGGYLSSVHLHCEEADGVVLGVKRILVVRTVVRIVIDAAQHQTFRQGAEEQVLVRVRPSTCWNGVHLTVDGSHRILDRALLESLDVGHLHGRIQGGLLCKQGGIDDIDLVIGDDPASHERKRRITAHLAYLDIDVVDQEFIINRSTCRRTTMSTTRLRTMFSRRATNASLAVVPSIISTASM